MDEDDNVNSGLKGLSIYLLLQRRGGKSNTRCQRNSVYMDRGAEVPPVQVRQSVLYNVSEK